MLRTLIGPLLVVATGGCLSTDGPLIEAPDAGGEPRVCVCGALMAQGEVYVSGGLAVREGLGASGGLLVDGQLTSGADRLGTNAHITVDRLVHRGEVEHGAALVITGDATLGGDLRVAGDLVIGGVLRQPDGAVIEVTGARRIASRRLETPPFTWPCDCDQRLDATADAPDDRRALGLNADALSNLQAATDLTLEEGRYVFEAIGGPGALALRVEGQVELAIRGAAQLAGGLTVDLGAGARFTLEVADDLVVSGPTRIGASGQAAAIEVRVGGRAVTVSERFELHGALIAPRATLATSVPLDWTGSVQIDGISAAADLRVR